MTGFPAANAISTAADQGAQKVNFEAMLQATKELLGASAETELTIAAGSITPTLGIHKVDTEADAAADDLTNILTTNHPDTRLLLIHCVDAGRVVTVKHAAGGAGAISLNTAADFVLDHPQKWLCLRRTAAGGWEEVFRSWGSDLAAFLAYLGLATAVKTDANQIFTKAQRGQIVTLTDTATITADLNASNKFKVTLGGNRTLANPSNLASATGQTIIVFVIQDGTGNRDLDYGTAWLPEDGIWPVLSTAAGSIDVLAGEVLSATQILFCHAANFKAPA
jgi:hypothetical protein